MSRLSQRTYWIALGGILALSFFWNLAVAGRGFLPIDQSAILDGAWRMHLGQVPFRDFLLTHGLTTMTLQWAAFEIFGVSYDSYLWVGSLQNLLGTLLILLVARRLIPDRPGWQLAAGLLTALWFQAPFGTPWVDESTYLFCMAAMLLLLRPGAPLLPAGSAREILAGLLIFGGFLSKQNAATLFLLVAACIPLARAARAQTELLASARIVSGFLLGLLLFLGWLWLAADPYQFYQGIFAYPAGTLLPRLERVPWETVTAPIIGKGNSVPRLANFVCLLAAGAWLWQHWQSAPTDTTSSDRFRFLARLSILLVLFENVFMTVTNNAPENCQPFSGLLLALLAPIAADLLPRLRPSLSGRTRILALTPIVLWVAMAARGIKVDWTRRAHDLFAHSSFTGEIDKPGWKALRWPIPYRLNDQAEIRIEDFNALIHDLEALDVNFFVWPDFTILYPILGKPDPTPLNYFWWGISYPRRYDRTLDERMLRDLQRHSVRAVVLDRAWFAMDANPRALSDFPLVQSWIHTHFEESARHGIFRLLTWNPR